MLKVEFDREWFRAYFAANFRVDAEKISDNFIDKLVNNPEFQQRFAQDVRDLYIMEEDGNNEPWDEFLTDGMKKEIGWEVDEN